MTTLTNILQKTREFYPSAQFRFLYPSLYLLCADEAFRDLTPEERLGSFARKIGISSKDIESAFSAAGFILCLVVDGERESEYAFLDTAPSSHHWIEFLANPDLAPSREPSTPFVHFYGFKGGQARSTVLAMTAQNLASDGYKVLIIDADVEAPSLQAVFDTAASSLDATLFGCAQYALVPAPQSVFVPKAGAGRADLLACRPVAKDYDLDFATFALRASLDPTTLESVITKILQSPDHYDAILVDHRSGLATSVIPLVAGFPGPVVVCLRLDEQSDHADAYFEVLFRLNSSNPGLFVSFSLDPEDSGEAMIGKHRRRIEDLLQGISNSLRRASEAVPGNGEEEDPSLPEADDLLAYWVPWFHDRSFLTKRLPSFESILPINQRSLASIREIIGFSTRKIAAPTAAAPSPRLHQLANLTSSGNTDRGTLIETDALRQLRVPSTPYTYIFGRKGTGKTRLLREIARVGMGEPMLVAEDFLDEKGISCSNTILSDLAAQLAATEPGKFWWALLDAILSGKQRSDQQLRLTAILHELSSRGTGAIMATSVREKVLSLPKKIVLLMDGVETAFNSAQMGVFVEELFRFLGTIQSDFSISQRLSIRLFIRTDLAEGARENIEQQIENRTIWLAWDTQSILNFVLVRMASIEWYRTNFQEVTGRIESRLAELVQGAVTEEDCSAILLQVFPEKLRRNNLLTLTFLKTYFSDGQGDKACFYPRIYDSFLQFIADGGSHGAPSNRPQIEKARIFQGLIFDAHDHACADYLKQVKDELKNLLQLANNTADNQQRINDLLQGFAGMKTPFALDACMQELLTKLRSSIDEPTLRKAMLQMKKVGIFEDRPGYPGYWRVGRLFKSSLGMRYNR